MNLTDISKIDSLEEAVALIVEDQVRTGSCFTTGEVCAHIRRSRPDWDFSHSRNLVPLLRKETNKYHQSLKTNCPPGKLRVYGTDLEAIKKYDGQLKYIPIRLPQVEKFTRSQLEELVIRIQHAMETGNHLP